MNEDVQRWMSLSDYDLATAEALLEAGRYLYVVFCCQQAVEKRLKGVVVKTIGRMPPRTHDLLRLVGLANLDLDEEQELFLRRLTNYYIETRYPEEVDELAQKTSAALAAGYLGKTKEAVTWLDSLLK